MSDDRMLRLQAALDGELDAQGMLAFERDCADDPELAAQFVRLRALDARLRDAMAVEPAPAALRARIEALAAAPRPKIFGAPPYAVAAALLLGVLAGFGGGVWRGAPDAERTLVSAFVRAQIGGRSVDVETSDRHVVKPWLAGRAPLAVAALDLSSAGFPLVGGRVETVDGRIVPTLVYRRREHRIDLTELPPAGPALRFESLDGYHVARWRDADRAYVGVTDLPEAELQDFVEKFRAAAKGETEPLNPKSSP